MLVVLMSYLPIDTFITYNSQAGTVSWHNQVILIVSWLSAKSVLKAIQATDTNSLKSSSGSADSLPQ